MFTRRRSTRQGNLERTIGTLKNMVINFAEENRALKLKQRVEKPIQSMRITGRTYSVLKYLRLLAINFLSH